MTVIEALIGMVLITIACGLPLLLSPIVQQHAGTAWWVAYCIVAPWMSIFAAKSIADIVND